MASEASSEIKPGNQQIRADRACVGCGFNLYGQRVVREEHYGLAIARCPECGVVAAIQSYPAMTHWVNRARAIFVGLWMIVLFGAFFASTMYQIPFYAFANEKASYGLEQRISEAHGLYQQRLRNSAPATAQPKNATATIPAGGQGPVQLTAVVTGGWGQLDEAWILEELPVLVDESGGVLANLDMDFLRILFPASIAALAVGAFWSVALLGARRRTALVVPVLAVVVAVSLFVGFRGSARFNLDAWSVARGLTMWWVLAIVAGWMLLLMALGVWCGRRLARSIVRLALPPRGRIPFSILWTRDGLEPPGTGTI